jgi:hypothetical protein
MLTFHKMFKRNVFLLPACMGRNGPLDSATSRQDTFGIIHEFNGHGNQGHE